MGWGRVSQHRKSGSRGGFGAVGFHKHKWIWVIKYAPNWYGKHGFRSVQQLKRKTRAVNVGELNELALDMLAKNVAIREGGFVVMNTIELGYDKVLGRGRVTVPLKLIVKEISETAKRKVEAAGGVVVSSGEPSK